MPLDINAIRNDAPATLASTYLNAGTNGPLSSYAAAAIAAAAAATAGVFPLPLG